MAIRRTTIYVVVAVLGMTTAVLSLSAAAWAATGGGGIQAPAGSTPSLSATSGTLQTTDAQSGNITVSASEGGVTLSTRASAMLRNQLRFSGTVAASDAGAVVEIERLGHETDWGWAPTAHSRVLADGSFTVVWHTDHIGRFAIRAVVEPGSAPRDASGSPTVTVTVYRTAIATQYGPGFYGQRTACGDMLRPGTLGVANRTLKCNTPVAIYYGGRTIVVPVIDRGPYANGADWDLTEATGRVLGIAGTATIGAVSLPRQP